MEPGATRLGGPKDVRSADQPVEPQVAVVRPDTPVPAGPKSPWSKRLARRIQLATRARRRRPPRLQIGRDDLDFDVRESSPSLYRRVFAEAPIAIALLDGELRIVDANRELVRILGRTGDELRSSPVTILAAPPYPARLALMSQKAATGGGPVVVEHRYLRSDGSEGWARTSIRRIDTGDPQVCMVCTIEDITSDLRALEEQRREAELDPLTGLLNRRGGDRRLKTALERMAQSGPIAVIICDADGFKEVNDRFGHGAGDEVLLGMAGRLRSAIRTGDDVARLGGDEFIVVARVADEREAASVAERCVRTVGRPFRAGDFGELPQQVTLSAGVAVAHPEGPVDAGALVAAADRALYEAKASGGNKWVLARSH